MNPDSNEREMHIGFPQFFGEDFDGWMLKVEHYFEVDATFNDDKLKLAVLHLNGRAIQWHQSFMKAEGGALVRWEEYTVAMRARLGSHGYDDPLVDLKNLKQVSILQHYQDAFEELYHKVGIREDQALSFFLAGLKDFLCL